MTACAAALFTSPANADDLKSILKDLDSYIENSNIYVQEKQERIDQLRQKLEGATCSDTYDINYSLFEEYQSFRYDSAYFYANRSLDLARQMNDQDKMVRSRCALVFCYMSSGLFLEAFDEMKKVDASKASADVKKDYYALYNVCTTMLPTSMTQRDGVTNIPDSEHCMPILLWLSFRKKATITYLL